MKIQLNIVPVVLFLAGCGGGDFSNSGLFEGTGAASGDAGTGGAGGGVTVTGGATGVTGGSGGALGGSGGQQAGSGGALGGSTGTSTGGQQAGSGGAPGGSTGTGTGGALGGTGGSTGTGGALGGTGGSTGTGTGGGGATGTCNPPVVTSASLPQQVVLDSYTGKVTTLSGDICLVCQHSPCTTCQLNWGIITPGAGLTFTSQATLSQCTPMPMNMGPCGSDLSQSSCTTWTPVVNTTFTFQLQPKADGTGYTTVIGNVSISGNSLPTINGTCDATLYRAAYDSSDYMQDFAAAEEAELLAIQWPCG